MKLNTFDAVNMAQTRKGDACISICRKGASSLSKAAVALTGWGGVENAMIAFHQDEDEPCDWYISLSEEGFTLRDDKDKGALYFNNANISNTMLDALGIEGDRAAFLLGAEPTEIDSVQYWALITAKPIIKIRKKK